MEFESLKSTEVDEYGTIAGSSPAFGTKIQAIGDIIDKNPPYKWVFSFTIKKY
jgi:hypothetical protein